MKIARKFVSAAAVALIALALLAVNLTSAFAYNGFKFKEEGQNPLGVAVTYYSDAYSRGFAWTTMAATADSTLQIIAAEGDKSAINWGNSTESIGSYVISDSGDTDNDGVNDTSYYCHKAYIENLEEGKYYYRVGSKADDNFSEIGTVEVTDPGDEINFIFATDPQESSETGFRAWANCVDAAYQTMPEADFFACGGDIVNDSHDAKSHDLDQWIYAMELPKQNFMNSVFVPAAGNHDSWASSFSDRYCIDYAGSTNQGGGYYSFDYGNLHFAVLNTNSPSADMDVQIKWLKEDLKNTDRNWKIVLMHKGLISTGDHSNDGDVGELRVLLLPIMAEYGVDMVLQGHDHVYARSVPYYSGEKQTGGQYNGKVPNLEETYIDEFTQDGKVTYSVEPGGTFYVTANYAGTKSYPPINYDTNLIYPATNPYNGQKMSVEIRSQMFTTVSIKGDCLYYNAYTYNASGITLYDTYNIKKNTDVAVGTAIDRLPAAENADIFAVGDIERVYGEYSALVPLAENKISAERKNKISALVEKFPLEDSVPAYKVAVLIKNLGEPNVSEAFRASLKSARAEYETLTETQKKLVSNYFEIAAKEQSINDIYAADAVNRMIAAYINGGNGVTIDELRAAYAALSESQKAAVDTSKVDLESAGGCKVQYSAETAFLSFAALILATAYTAVYQIKKRRNKQ